MKTLTTLATGLAFALLPASAFAACGPAADRDPASAGSSLRAARSSTLCLLNRERRHHHLHRLRFNHKLALAGLRHARDMVGSNYFSHDAPSGEDFVQRIMSTGYVPAAAAWTVGENLAWGDEHSSTPRQIVHAWMHSPGHRH